MTSSVPSAERNHRRRSEPANSEKKDRNIFPNRESSQKINGLSRFARDLTRPVGGMLHPINDLVVQRLLNGDVCYRRPRGGAVRHCYSKKLTLTRRFNFEEFNSNPMLLQQGE